MVDELTADEIRTLLRLEPHATCGSVRVTYLSPQSIAAGGLPPFSDPRPMGSALYFMVTPTAPVQLHRIRNDQLYHYYLGDPLEVLLLRSDGTSDRVVVGPNLRGGEFLQLFIPGGTFHTARVMGRRAGGDRCGELVDRSGFERRLWRANRRHAARALPRVAGGASG